MEDRTYQIDCYRCLPSAAIDDMLTYHDYWLESNGARGRRAVFTGCDVSRFRFDDWALDCIDFAYSNMHRVVITHSSLHETSFEGAYMASAVITSSEGESKLLLMERISSTSNFKEAIWKKLLSPAPSFMKLVLSPCVCWIALSKSVKPVASYSRTAS